MKMKYLLGSLLSFMISVTALAQNNTGADYLSLGEISLAKEYFMKTMRQTPAESNYYLGEIALLEGNTAEAKKCYEAGLAANPESGLAAVGIAKLSLKADPKETEKIFKDIQKKNKKDVTVILAIAKAYLENDMKDMVLEKLQDARKANKKDPYIYIFEGDMFAKDKKPGDAAQQYDQAINFDPNCVLAYVKGAKVYEFINREQAASMLRKAVEIRPDFRVAYKELAWLYQRDGFYPQAIEGYKEYFKGERYNVEDIRRYAGAEFFVNNYAGSMKLLEEGLQKHPNDFVLNRLLMYNSNELKDYQKGLEAGNNFFGLSLSEGDTIRTQDYKIYANILNQIGDKARAVEQYKKLLSLHPDDKDLYKEIATVCGDDKAFVEAASFYNKYVELAGEEADAQDYFILGRYYYFSSDILANDTVSVTAEEARAKSIEALKKADVAFATLAERMPDKYQGNFWRARVNSSLDPETTEGLAKPFYESTIQLITAEKDPSDADKKTLVEAYRYLSFFHYIQYEKSKKAEDKDSIKLYAEKILELDPENKAANDLLNYVTQ